jgi:ABC-type branched-subunit amino acid transport system substrate-binding protein
MRAGATAYLDFVNRQGGVHGRKIVLQSLDDGQDTERARANVAKLVQESNVFALLGCTNGASCVATVPVATASKVPFFATHGNEALRTPFNRYVFNVRAGFDAETEHIVEHLVTMTMTRIAVFHFNDAPGKAARASVEAALTKRNLTLAAAGTAERNSMNVGEGVRAIASAEPQAVIVFAPYKPAAEFIRQMKKAGREPQFITLSVVGATQLATELGDAGRGVGISQVVPYPWVAREPVVDEYHRLYVREKKGAPAYASLEGFIAAKVLVEGLRRAGRPLTVERFVAAMEGMRDADLGGYAVTYSPQDRNGARFVELTVIGAGGKVLR